MVCAFGVKLGATAASLIQRIAPCVQEADSLRLLEPQHVMHVRQVQKPVTVVHKDVILVSLVLIQIELQAHRAQLAKLEHSLMDWGQLLAKTVLQGTQLGTLQPKMYLSVSVQEESF
mmetsp:Transcript_39182/g.72719  ORF Transcript_39182/g.72719 Transcript_39182/m.72719 type:complete len:117 (-) Transcript_39182:1325-1675(-)